MFTVKRLNDIALLNKSQSYEALLTVCDHTVLPALPNPSQTGQYSIYQPQGDGRLSRPRWLVTYRLENSV